MVIGWMHSQLMPQMMHFATKMICHTGLALSGSTAIQHEVTVQNHSPFSRTPLWDMSPELSCDGVWPQNMLNCFFASTYYSTQRSVAWAMPVQAFCNLEMSQSPKPVQVLAGPIQPQELQCSQIDAWYAGKGHASLCCTEVPPPLIELPLVEHKTVHQALWLVMNELGHLLVMPWVVTWPQLCPSPGDHCPESKA